jgi:hypothetical protein
MSNRYIVIRRADVLDLLDAAERQTLAALLNKIEQERDARKREVGTPFFVLNARDIFAQPALEAYIKAAREDKRYQELDGIKLAVKAAQEARLAGIMAGQKLPTSPRK